MAVNDTIRQQQFPNLDTPLIDPLTGQVAIGWQQFFITLWQKSGAANSVIQGLVYIIQPSGTASQLEVFDAVSGQSLGIIELGQAVGGDAQPQQVGNSPFEFVAPDAGFMGIKTGQVEFSRDSGATWYVLGVTGGAVPVRRNDRIRVTWFGSVAPEITYFPN